MPVITTISLHCSGSSSQCDSTLKIKSITFGKEGKLLSLFFHDMIVYPENSRESTEKLMRLLKRSVRWPESK